MSLADGPDLGPAASRLRSAITAITLGDAILLAYLVAMSLCVSRASPTPTQAICARQLYLSGAALVVGCYAARVAGLPRSIAGVLYRLVLLGVVLVDYLMLRDVLPLVRPDSVDAALVALDVRVFGVEPSLWLERLNRRPIVEWFSFFYFSYFTINVSYFLVVVCLARAGRRTAEFAIGTALVFSVGQLGYLAVPGFGPIRFLAHQFVGPVNGGFFWGMVTRTVNAGSAMKDIFPSLHTAVPTWFTCFAARRARRDRRWIAPAIVTGFFAANIVFSTVFLRWHYVVDVLAGLALGLGTGWLAPRLALAEERWRLELGLPQAWDLVAPRAAARRANKKPRSKRAGCFDSRSRRFDAPGLMRRRRSRPRAQRARKWQQDAFSRLETRPRWSSAATCTRRHPGAAAVSRVVVAARRRWRAS